MIAVAFDGIAKVYGADISIVTWQGCVGASGAWEACVRGADISVVTVEWREETFSKQGIALLDRTWVSIGAIDGYISAFIAFDQNSTIGDFDGHNAEVYGAFIRIFASLKEGRTLACQSLAFVDGTGVVVVADGGLVLAMCTVAGVLRTLATVIAIRIAVTEQTVVQPRVDTSTFNEWITGVDGAVLAVGAIGRCLLTCWIFAIEIAGADRAWIFVVAVEIGLTSTTSSTENRRMCATICSCTEICGAGVIVVAIDFTKGAFACCGVAVADRALASVFTCNGDGDTFARERVTFPCGTVFPIGAFDEVVGAFTVVGIFALVSTSYTSVGIA